MQPPPALARLARADLPPRSQPLRPARARSVAAADWLRHAASGGPNQLVTADWRARGERRGEAGRTLRRTPAGRAVAASAAGVGGKSGTAKPERPSTPPTEAEWHSGRRRGRPSGEVRAEWAEVRPASEQEGRLSRPGSLPPGRCGAHTLEHSATRFPNVRLLLCPIIGRSDPTSCCCPTSYPALSGPREVCILCPTLGLLPSCLLLFH